MQAASRPREDNVPVVPVVAPEQRALVSETRQILEKSGFFTHVLDSLKNFVEALTNKAIRERIERNLTPKNRDRINQYRDDVVSFAQHLILKFSKFKSLYDIIVRYQNIDEVVQELLTMSVEDETKETLRLVKENGDIRHILKNAAEWSVYNILVENKYAILVAAIGLLLMAIPGLQFGIPAWLEKALAIGGGAVATVGISVTLFNSKIKEEEVLAVIQERLQAVQNKMMHMREKLLDFKTKKDRSDANIRLLKEMASELCTLCQDIITEGIELEKAALQLPELRESPGCIVL